MKKRNLLLLFALLALHLTATADPNPTLSTRLSEAHPIIMPELVEYPILIRAAMEDEIGVSIVEVIVTVDGDTIPTGEAVDHYYALWRPEVYAEHEVHITAISSEGVSTSITRNVTVQSGASVQTVRTMDNVVIEFSGTNSRWFEQSYSLPQFVGGYRTVRANLNVTCPSVAGGCDDWDRLAWIEIKDAAGNWVELIRYITPYSVGCNHSLDVSHLASLLQGDVEIRMFIDTWGTGGWEITLDFKYFTGTPLHLYSRVDKIWDGSYDFGNPANLQPVPTTTFQFPENAEQGKMFLTNTGHGWGNNNSNNAAEFYHAYHDVRIDDADFYEHDLWNDCNPNPDNCSPQSGNWSPNRAGWCPGAITEPEEINFQSYLGESSFSLNYRFQESYVDECHANNPSCVSGVTCPDCNDGYNPIYYVDAVMVSYADVPLFSDDYEAPPPLPTGLFDNLNTKYRISMFPNPTANVFHLTIHQGLTGSSKVVIYSVDGSALKQYAFHSVEALESYDFDLSGLSAGQYFIRLSTGNGEGVEQLTISRD